MNKLLSRVASIALAMATTFTSLDVSVYAAQIDEPMQGTEYVQQANDSQADVTSEESTATETATSENTNDETQSAGAQEDETAAAEANSSEESTQEAASADAEQAEDEDEALEEEVEEIEEKDLLESTDDLEIEGTIVKKYKGNGGAVVIPDGITKIADSAFYDATITSVTFPSTLETIEYRAFANCYSLHEIIIPASVRKIGLEAFYVYQNATSTVVDIKSTAIEAGQNVFSGRTLTSVSLPAGMQTLPSLFGEASFTTGYTLQLPASITKIENFSFYAVKGLKTVAFTGNNLNEICDCAFYDSSISEIAFPSSLEKIGYRSFYNCVNLSEINLPSSLKEIGMDAFGTDNAPASTTTINVASKSFTGSHNIFTGRTISSVTLPEGMVTLPELFEDASFTTGYIVELPASITTIDDFAFDGAKGLKTVKITGNKLKNIEDNAFANSSISDIALPSSVEKIGYRAFYNCVNLTEINLPESLKEVKMEAFATRDATVGTTTVNVASKSFTTGYCLFQGRTISSVTLPEGMVTLPQLFSQTAFTTGYVVQIPSTVTTIDSGAFSDVKGLKTVAFTGKKLTEIKQEAFRESSITEITLPSSVKKIGYIAFYNCKSLERVYLSSDITLEREPFSGCELAYFYITGTGSTTHDNLVKAGIDEDRIVTSKSITEYTVTLDPGATGTVSVSKIVVTKGKTYGEYKDAAKAELPTPTCAGKTFRGWYTEEGELVTASTKVTDEAKDQVLYARYKNDVNVVENPVLYTSNGQLVPTDGILTITDVDKLELKTATAGAKILYTVNDGTTTSTEAAFAESISVEADKTYTITAKAKKDSWKDSDSIIWKVKVEDSISDTPALYDSKYAGKFWVVYNGEIYDESKVKVGYTGANVTLSGYEVYFGKNKLQEKVDYTVSYKNNKNEAAYDAAKAPTMVIKGKGNTKGSLELRFGIELTNKDAVKLTNGNTVFELAQTEFDYDGTAKTPAVKTLEVKATKTAAATPIAGGYTVSYEKNVAAGTAKAIVTFDGTQYYGVLTKTFKINKVDIASTALVAITTSTGKVTYNNGYNGLVSIKNKVTGEDLVLKADYTISKASVKSKDMTATQTITGKGSFKGTYKFTYSIEKAELGGASVQNFVAPVVSKKKGVYKPVAFKVYMGGVALKSSEYSVSYKVNGQTPDNKTVYGTDAKVVMTIQGKGNYTGTKTYEYSPVAGYDITDESILWVSVSDAAYTGKANGVNPKIVIKNTYTNKNLKNKTDYVVSYKYVNETEIKRTAKKTAVDYVACEGEAVKAKDIVPAGTKVMAVIEGKGAYDGNKIEKVFTVGYDLSKASVKINNQDYTGKRIIPSKNDITVKVAGKTLSPNEYNIVLADSANIKAGTGKITITGADISCNQKTVKFKIVAKKLTKE